MHGKQSPEYENNHWSASHNLPLGILEVETLMKYPSLENCWSQVYTFSLLSIVVEIISEKDEKLMIRNSS